MSLKKDIIGAEVQIGTNQAQAELAQLSKETAQYNNENERLRLIMKKLELQGKKNSDEWKKAKKQLDANSLSVKQNKLRQDELTKSLGLTSLTSKQLRTKMRQLKQQLDSTVPNTKEWDRYNKELLETKTRYTQLNAKSRQTKGFLTKLKGAAGGLLPAFGFAAIVAGAGRVLKSMFDLTKQIQGETIRSVTVFGDQLGYVENQAEKVAEKMGVTNREFASMAANTADLLIPLDFARDKAAQMAAQVQGLSGALDEWTAGKYGVAEVSNILTKAMLGEMEQLKGLGIAIRQDSEEFINLVKQKEAVTGTTKAQARAMATLELLYKKSADAQAAYQLEGNKLLRFQKSLNLSFKNFKENIATGWAESMKTATQLYIDQQREVNNLEKNLTPLIDQYEELSTKQVPLSSDEQERLNGLIAQIGEIAPSAITQIDEYGKILGISASKAKELVEVQRAMLLIKNADAIEEQEKALEQLNTQVSVLQTKLSQGELTEFGEWQKLGAKETAKLNIELQELGKKRSGIEGLLKTLRGEPLIDTKSTNESTEAVTSLIEVQEDLLTQAKQWPETTEKEIIAKNRRIETIETEIKRLKELGTVKSKNSSIKDETKKTVKVKEVNIFEFTTEKASEIEAKKEEYDILKAMEADWLKYEKEASKEGRDIALKNIESYEAQTDGYIELTNAKIWAAGQAIDVLISMAGKETAVGKALFLLNQARAIGEVIFNTGIGNSKAIAASPLTFGQPWVAINTISAAGSIASILAQTIESFSGKKQGGYADNYSSDDTVAGIYHANEFIASAPAVRNPAIKRVLDIIDLAQRNGTVATLNLPAVIGAGRQTGGYANSSIPSPPLGGDAEGRGGIDPAVLAIIQANTEAIKNLKIYTSIEDIKTGEKNFTKIENTRGL